MTRCPKCEHAAAELVRIAGLLGDAVDAVALLSAHLEEPATPAPTVLREVDFLEPRVIAQRLPIGETWVRKLCARALDRGDPGVRKIGERGWLASIECIERERRR